MKLSVKSRYCTVYEASEDEGGKNNKKNKKNLSYEKLQKATKNHKSNKPWSRMDSDKSGRKGPQQKLIQTAWKASGKVRDRAIPKAESMRL